MNGQRNIKRQITLHHIGDSYLLQEQKDITCVIECDPFVTLCFYNERYNYCVCGCMNITGNMKTNVFMKNSPGHVTELSVWCTGNA